MTLTGFIISLVAVMVLSRMSGGFFLSFLSLLKYVLLIVLLPLWVILFILYFILIIFSKEKANEGCG